MPISVPAVDAFLYSGNRIRIAKFMVNPQLLQNNLNGFEQALVNFRAGRLQFSGTLVCDMSSRANLAIMSSRAELAARQGHPVSFFGFIYRAPIGALGIG